MVIFILKVINMAFRTKLDYSDNRQINQRERTSTVLSGGSVFGVAYSALTSGIDYTSTGGTEFVAGPLISTFSGNGTTTIFTWYDPRMDLVNSQVSAITNITSGLSQSFTVFTVDSTGTTLDGYDYNAFYTGVTFEFQPQLIYSGVGPSYTGTVSSASGVTFLSANSLDYSGRTIWVDNPEITRTKRFIVTNNPSIGHVLTCDSAEGEATWSSISAATSGVTFWEEGGDSNGAIKDEKGGHSLSGGVAKSMIAGGELNTLTESAWSMMGGGLGNTIEGSSDRSSIIGGYQNTLTNSSDKSIILVGEFNTMNGSDSSVIIAGENNKLSGGSDSSAIIAGDNNTIDNSLYAGIVGGNDNVINNNSDYSVVLGGYQNLITGHTLSYIIGGSGNTVDFSAFVGVGEGIIGSNDSSILTSNNASIIGSVSGTVEYSQLSSIVSSWNSSISGTSVDPSDSTSNIIYGSAGSHIKPNGSNESKYSSIISSFNSDITGGNYSSIIGGEYSEIFNSVDSVVIGGVANFIDNSNRSSILGGRSNSAHSISNYSILIGGDENEINSSQKSVIAGGEDNTIEGSSDRSSIIGGEDNVISASTEAFIGGGSGNTLNGERSVILGGLQNTITGHTDGAIIGGTGNTIDFCLGSYGSVSSSGEFILGGFDNLVYNSEGSGIIGSYNSGLSGGTNSVMMATSGSSMVNKRSVLLGGANNTISSTPGYYQGIASLGYPDIDFGYGASSIIGGLGNTNYGSFTSIIGGVNNEINADCSIGGSSIIGGHLNTISGDTWSSIIGGQNNEILVGTNVFSNQDENSIIGGDENIISGTTKSFIGGGKLNAVYVSDKSFIGGGSQNNIDGADESSIIGGSQNNIVGADESSIIGGLSNTITGSTPATANRSVIAGGWDNDIFDSKYTSIIGGYKSKIQSTSSYSTILGGFINELSGSEYTTIVGGRDSSGYTSDYGFMGGGLNNRLERTSYSAIIGGRDNVVSGDGSTNTMVIIASHNSNLLGTNWGFIAGSSSSTIYYAPRSVIVGGDNNTIANDGNTVFRSGIFAGSGNTITDGNQCAIIGGTGNVIDLSFGNDHSVIIGGEFNVISNANRSVIIGGTNITATTDDMVYVPDLIIDGLTSVTDLQTNSDGKIINGVSDISFKDNVQAIKNPLDKILKLNPVSFEWTPEIKLREGTIYGLIAQEVQEVIPEMVTERAKGDGTLTLEYKEIIPWIIGAIQELAGDNSPILNRDELILETQTIASEDNNIELNFNGTHDSALNGGITVIKGINDETNSVFEINSDGDWHTNNYILPHGLVIPKFTPISTNDDKGKLGEITRDDDYIYIKTEAGWKRTGLETF